MGLQILLGVTVCLLPAILYYFPVNSVFKLQKSLFFNGFLTFVMVMALIIFIMYNPIQIPAVILAAY